MHHYSISNLISNLYQLVFCLVLIDPIIFKTISLVSITPSLMIFTFFSVNKFHRFYPSQRSFFITFFIFFTYFLFLILTIYIVDNHYCSRILSMSYIRCISSKYIIFLIGIVNSSITFL